MAIEITSDTLVKILVRRGQNSDRITTILSEGELGYTVDTQRLFIGDGVSQGGRTVSNLFLGRTSNKNLFTSLAFIGDLIYDTKQGNLFSYNGLSWDAAGPLPYPNSIENPEAIGGLWRVSRELIGDGFNLEYTDTGLPNSIQQTYGKINLDTTYWSLCSLYQSFYFGDARNRYVKNSLEARVNIDDKMYINGNVPNPNQIQIRANQNTIEAVSGNFNILAKDALLLKRNNTTLITLDNNNNILFTPPANGDTSSPDLDFSGLALFRNNIFCDANATITGNLSVYGDLTYLETVISTTSALSVVNTNKNSPALVVWQKDTSQQGIARFDGDNNIHPAGLNTVLTIADGPFVGIGTESWATKASQSNANFSVSGAVSFAPRPGGDDNNFVVRTGINAFMGLSAGAGGIIMRASGGNIQIDSSNTYLGKAGPVYISPTSNVEIQPTGTVLIRGSTTTINPAGALTLQPGSGTLQINGATNCTGDITAFTSDERLKDITGTIPGALEKVLAISGIIYKHNKKAIDLGFDDKQRVGVIAQEIQKVLPEAVVPAPFDLDKDNNSISKENYLTVQYEKIVPLLIEAIKQLAGKKSCSCSSKH